ncbi:hypothetical protein JCGZ_07281 [Jatropha curcas]|uniref:Galactose oxidase-like Early set domain-containing protein n=1 Tax=Jatropha curcas TaxID=180498 RepID=A0A067KN86_JATCU|nr:aldehyde oxidase GLOX1 [Jatropha curcas]KDP33710.1 hypothetical protein JCGZ_07281 [Jatropha curcas]
MAIIFKILLLLSLLFVFGYAHEDAKGEAKDNATGDAKDNDAETEAKLDAQLDAEIDATPNAFQIDPSKVDPNDEKTRKELEEWLKKDAYKMFNEEKVLGPHEMFGDPFGNPQDFKAKKIPDDFGTPTTGDVAKVTADAVSAEASGQGAVGIGIAAKDEGGDAEKAGGKAGAPSSNAEAGGEAPSAPMPVALGYKGEWELVSENSGVSSMHAILLPKTEKVLMYDATIWKISKIELPNGKCRVLDQATGEKDCWCHSVLYDINDGKLTPLELNTDTWCSSGGLDIEGTLVSTGGFQGGANTVRYLGTAEGSDWREYPTALADRRWYSTQATLPDGAFIVIGGREAFSYEYIPKEGQSNPKPFAFEFLRQTSDPEENNLYPFVYLSTDGNVFIFANSRSVLLNPTTNQIVKEFPELPGGCRNYPASGASVLLPLVSNTQDPKEIVPAEVLICGGSAHKDSYSQAEKQIFYEALEDCGRMIITDTNPVWKRELMPTPRIMGDMMVLATGEVLILNGAKRGASGWGFAREPNFTPVLYSPTADRGARFTELAPSTIPRMYHSTSTVLPDGKILVAGSNTNNGYIYDAMYPTELRVEKYSPPYLNAAVIQKRPEIVTFNEQMTYAQNIDIEAKIAGDKVQKQNVCVTMYSPAFTTHGVNMNQRLIVLGVKEVIPANGNFKISATAPISNAVAPVGYYMLSVIFEGVPSITKWVQIK